MPSKSQQEASDLLELIHSQSMDNQGLSLSDKLFDINKKDREAVRTARNLLQKVLLGFLGFEIFFIAYIMISQAVKFLIPFKSIPFSLTDWQFTPFVTVALVQTCILIRPIANNLFPNNKKEDQ